MMRLLTATVLGACAAGGSGRDSTASTGSTVPAASASAVAARDTLADAETVSGMDPAKLVEYYAAPALSHIDDSLSHTARTGHVLRAHPTFQTIELRRIKDGVPEVHDHWTDVMMFQSGRATLLLGGRVTGSAILTGPGEHRGGTISGGSERPVAAGDVLVIPAGMPHQIQIARGDSLRYITVKVP